MGNSLHSLVWPNLNPCRRPPPYILTPASEFHCHESNSQTARVSSYTLPHVLARVNLLRGPFLLPPATHCTSPVDRCQVPTSTPSRTPLCPCTSARPCLVHEFFEQCMVSSSLSALVKLCLQVSNCLIILGKVVCDLVLLWHHLPPLAGLFFVLAS